MKYRELYLEWRRIRSRIRRNGFLETHPYVLQAIRKKRFHAYNAYRFCKLVMKKGQVKAAVDLLVAVDRIGVYHEVFSELYARCLWMNNEPKAAISYGLKIAKYWNSAILYSNLSAMHTMNNNPKLAKRYLDIARALADRERAKLQKKGSRH